MKTNGHSHDSLETVLRMHGFKYTGPRREILECMAHADKPLSIKEMNGKLKAKKIDPVTIYRTVKTFTQKGIVRQVDFGHDQSYFELADQENDHHHIVCTTCHKISDFIGCEAERLVKNALKQSKDFKQIVRHSFEFYGICNTCAESK